MDESWKMRMGMPSGSCHHHPRRRFLEDMTRRSSMDSIDPQDFSDVFGGPPRTVTSRKFSGDFTRPSETFYQEIFKPPEFVSHVNKGGGGGLPAFRIPANGERFYGDLFGGKVEVDEDEGRLSRERSRPNSTAKSKSKSNSSSVLSSEELNPLGRQVIVDDVTLSSITSRLRPINVPCRWNSETMRPEEQPINPVMPPLSSNNSLFTTDAFNFTENDHDESPRGSYFKVLQRVSSPVTISFEPNSFRSVKISVDDLELDSPSSPVSSLCLEAETKELNTTKEEIEQEDDEVASSYVIEINSDRRNGTAEAVSLNEAIVWAKENFHAQCFDRENKKDCTATEEDEPKTMGKQAHEEERKRSPSNEIKLLDEDVRLWSSGNESNIRVLLSILHHILWPNCGWHAIPITNLIEGLQVKKAYQKARLCLHPDKMQQRGATIHQKYVAEKAFSILQEAWSTFLSQEAVFN